MSLPTLLIGERDPFMRRTLSHFLTPKFQLHFTEDGATLVEAARTLHPHLIVLEILLPRQDGLQVCRTLKSDPATRAIPVLVFTWLNAEERALLAGADAFLPKPFEASLFSATLQRLLSRRGETP